MTDDKLSKQAEVVSATLKQLAHPDRLRVLCCLTEKEKTVSELIEFSGASQSWVSQLLSRMKLEGLVDSRKEGNFVYYKISDPRLKELMQAIYKTYCLSGKTKRE